MEKFLLAFAFLLLILPLEAQHKNAGHKSKHKPIPELVLASFTQENPDIEPAWKNQDTNYRAEFIDAMNIAHIRVYSRTGRMVYRDDVMESYPAPIHAYYDTKYQGEGYVVWSRIDQKGTLSYYTFRNGDTLWFDKDGNIQNSKKGKSRFNDSISVIGPVNN